MYLQVLLGLPVVFALFALAVSAPWGVCLQVLLGLPVVIALFALAVSAAGARGEEWRRRLAARARHLVLAYGAAAFALALADWWLQKDWVHGLWTTTHPQLVLAAGAGAFLVRGRRGPWIVLGSLLAFALLPAALIQWAGDPDAGARNVGRPIAGTLEVVRFGLGGAMPEMLVPENEAGEARGLGFLPREVTVPVGALATAAVLWIAVCVVKLAGGLMRSRSWRERWLLLAPFDALFLLWAPMPFGLNETALWRSEPALLRGFGPLLVAALLASAFVPLGRRLARENGPARPEPVSRVLANRTAAD